MVHPGVPSGQLIEHGDTPMTNTFKALAKNHTVVTSRPTSRTYECAVIAYQNGFVFRVAFCGDLIAAQAKRDLLWNQHTKAGRPTDIEIVRATRA